MNKKLIIVGLLVFLAAGCSGLTTVRDKTSENPDQSGAGVQNMEVAPSAEASQVSGVDEAVNLLEAHSSSEQSITIGSDDSDLSASDTQELNSLLEVPNE